MNKKELRVDAPAKLRGESRYIRDEKIPGMWYGTTVRSLHAHAKIKSITFKDDYDWDSVVVISAKDIPVNYVAMLENDMPFLAEDIVRYVGEPIVLIAAPTKELADNAKEYVKIEYEILPHNFDMLQSEKSDVKIFKENNVFKAILIEKGNLDQAQKQSDKIIEIEVRTGFQEHLYLEPQGIIAIPQKDKIVIRGSLQCPYYIKNALVNMFDNKKHITVIQVTTGGAFGGKEDFPSLLAGHGALLADKCGKPVAMFYDREEDVKVTTKRHPSYHNDKAYVTKDGKIIGLDLNMILDGGAYCTLSQVVLSRAALTACGSYYVPIVRVSAKAVATNTVPGGAFRGFGGPQATFAIEMLIEKIANELSISPLEIRKKNLLTEGKDTATGQVLKYSVSAKETLTDALNMSDYQNKYSEFENQNYQILEKIKQDKYPKIHQSDKLKGIGITTFQHGAGFTGTGENKIQGKIRVEINEQGKPVIFTAITEMGQGEQTAFRKMLSDALEIEMDDVMLSEVNTDFVPDSGPTVASRSTMIVGELIVRSANELIEKLTVSLNKDNKSKFHFRHGSFHENGTSLSFKEVAKKYTGLEIEQKYEHPPIIKFDDINYKGDAYPVFSWAAAVAEIEVDPVTFEIKVTDYYTSHEIGKAINYDQAVAQIQGGSLQGIGYAIYEKVELINGEYDVTGFTDYIIPTPADTPKFHVNILENPYPFGPFGAKGLGELPLVGGPPAVLSALWMIFGKEFNKIPVMPEDLMKKLKMQ
jgi:CO/xanthine dehydrogenase Mo-binding subunit